jgi:hypothetical protein
MRLGNKFAFILLVKNIKALKMPIQLAWNRTIIDIKGNTSSMSITKS